MKPDIRNIRKPVSFTPMLQISIYQDYRPLCFIRISINNKITKGRQAKRTWVGEMHHDRRIQSVK